MSKAVELILASKSAARVGMLRAAGLSFQSIPAAIDEDAFKDGDLAPETLAQTLSYEKALAVSKQNPAALVIGSDQVLECNGQTYSKAKNVQEAKEKLQKLSGKTHHLHSGVSVVQNGAQLWSRVARASLTMHDLEDDMIEQYMQKAGDVLTHCAGAYAIEAHGAWLFEKIEGSHFTILGMPLLPLLRYLHQSHGITP